MAYEDDLPFLSYTDGEGRRRELLLQHEPVTVSIGRAPDADLPLGWDEQVSRLHATLHRVGEHWTLADDGLSRNGTFVNGARVSGRRQLRHGDVLRLGATSLVYQHVREQRVPATRSSLPLPELQDLPPVRRAVLVALCRPYKGRAPYAVPATTNQIADDLGITPDTVTAHLRALHRLFAVDELPSAQRRVRLVERALESGVVVDRDLVP